MINVLLLHTESEAKLTNTHVYDEIERISFRLGRDFTQFIKDYKIVVQPDGIEEKIYGEHPKTGEPLLYFSASRGTLQPENWIKIPPYGTEGDIPDSAAGFALFFLTTTGMPFAPHHIDWADFVWICFEDRVGAIIEAFRVSGKSIFMRILMAYLIGLSP